MVGGTESWRGKVGSFQARQHVSLVVRVLTQLVQGGGKPVPAHWLPASLKASAAFLRCLG